MASGADFKAKVDKITALQVYLKPSRVVQGCVSLVCIICTFSSSLEKNKYCYSTALENVAPVSMAIAPTAAKEGFVVLAPPPPPPPAQC